MVRHLDPAAALAFRTPLQEHTLSADGKAAGVLTLLGLMFTVLARFAAALADVLADGGGPKVLCTTLLTGFALAALATIVQAFRTISPRFPDAPPSLAFFGDIARLTRDEYLARVKALGPAEALAHMLAYNHTSAVILADKFAQLRLGLRAFRAAAACWVALTLVLACKGLR